MAKKKPHKKVQKPRKPMSKAWAKHLQRQAEQAAARKATNMTKTAAKHEAIARKAAEAAGASEDVARDLAKGMTGSKQDIRRQAEEALKSRQSDYVSRAENKQSRRSKTYADQAEYLRKLLEGDYWDLAEAAASGRYQEALQHNVQYLERKLEAVRQMERKYKTELNKVDNTEDQMAIKQILNDLDKKKKEIDKIIQKMQHSITAKYNEDPLGEYFNAKPDNSSADDFMD